MADKLIHTGKDPPSLKMSSSTLKVLPPESPLQPDLFPLLEELQVNDNFLETHAHHEEKFVDLKQSNREQVTTTTHNISCTQPSVAISNPLAKVVHGRPFGLSHDPHGQGHQRQNQFVFLPHFPARSSTRSSTAKTFEDGPSLKLQCYDGSFDDETTKKKGQPLPAFLYGDKSFEDEKQKEVPVGLKKLYSEEPIKFKKTFVEGKIVLGTTEALHDLLQSYKKIEQTTGVICDQDLNPDGNQYEKNAHYIEEQLLGQGSFGSVHLAMDSNRGKLFVHKQISKESFAKNEVLVPSRLNQVNITRLYGVIHRVSPAGEHMELLIENAGMSLNKYRTRHPEMAKTEAVVWDFCKQGFRAFDHMDKFGITHLDIKPENVCLTDHEDGFVHMKITDFGSAKFAHEPMHFIGLTPEYLSPELCKLVLQKRHKELSFGLSDDDITGKSDMFAFALVVMFIYKNYHILQNVITNGKNSYDGYLPEQKQNLHMMLIVQVAQDENFVKRFIPDECSMDMRLLLSKMLENDPIERLSAKEALKAVEDLDKQVANGKQRLERIRVKPSEAKLQIPSLFPEETVHGFVPEIAGELMESDHGPVKSATKDRLRKKINDPYTRGAKGSGKGRTAMETSQTAVMTPRHVASKKMPLSPVSPMANVNAIVGVTERNAPIAQPSADNDATMDTAASLMIDIRKRPALQFEYPPAVRGVRRDTRDAMPVDCVQTCNAPTAGHGQVTGAQWQPNDQDMRRLAEVFQRNGLQVSPKVNEQIQKMLKFNKQKDLFINQARRAGIEMETEQNGAEASNVPRFDKIF